MFKDQSPEVPMQSLLRRASLIALLVGVNLVVSSHESAAELAWQHCQWISTGNGGCAQGCTAMIFANCGDSPCWLDYEGGCPHS